MATIFHGNLNFPPKKQKIARITRVKANIFFGGKFEFPWKIVAMMDF
jgi:hypothetical protein